MSETKIIKGKSSDSNYMKPLMRVAAYCRVSTDSVEQAASFESQRKYFIEKIMSTKGWVLVDIYADEGITGTSFKKRKGFQRMIDDCLAGKIDMVITKSLSRFSRNTEDTLKYVRMLRDRSIPIIFEEEHINTCSMEGELLLTVLGAVYQQEVENTSNHVKLGFKMKMKRGEMLGQPRAYGYDYDKESKTLVVNPQEAEVVRWIFEQYVAGLGGRRIAIELEKRGIKAPKSDYWNAGVIVRIIKNVKYRGDLLNGKTYVNNPIQRKTCLNFGERDRVYVKDHHIAIVEPELFDKAQEVLRERQEHFSRGGITGKHRIPKDKGPFSRKLFCANCGRCLIRRHVKKRREDDKTGEKWQCGGYANHNNSCKTIKEWDAEWIENAFVSSFNLLCRQGKTSMDAFLDTMKSVLKKKDKERKFISNSVKEEVDRLQGQVNALLSQNLEGNIENSFFQARYEFLRRELESAKRMVTDVGTQEDKAKRIESRIRSIQERLRKVGPLEAFDADVFSSVVERVVVGEPGEEESEYITFIYRDGEKSSFNMEEFRKAVELKRQLNNVTAYQNDGKTNTSAKSCSSAASKGIGNNVTTRSVKGCLRDKKDTDEISGVHGYPVKDGVDCSTHSVNRCLRYDMSTCELDGREGAGGEGCSADGAEECSTHSVKVGTYRRDDRWHYGFCRCPEIFCGDRDGQYG